MTRAGTFGIGVAVLGEGEWSECGMGWVFRNMVAPQDALRAILDGKGDGGK